eukprot:3161-Eustigmatos_ZCMA.PRE.1
MVHDKSSVDEWLLQPAASSMDARMMMSRRSKAGWRVCAFLGWQELDVIASVSTSALTLKRLGG